MTASAEALRFRAQVFRFLRDYFESRGFLEVETPLLVTCPGGEPYLRYFSTMWHDERGRRQRKFLRSSPELHMKQILSHALPKIFQLGRCFRNGGEHSDWHHPEFTLLEWYEAGAEFEGFIAFTTELLCELFRHHGQGSLPKLHKIGVYEAFAEFAGITLHDNDPQLAREALGKGCHSVQADDDFHTAFFKVLLERIEPRLRELGNVVLYDYPPSQAALAQVEGGRAKRFEVYLDGIEVCNAFGECVDAAENARRFVEFARLRREHGLPPVPRDAYFNAALQRGLPPACGNALGIDRVLALLRGESNLDRVIPFRHQLRAKLKRQRAENTHEELL